MCKLVQLDNTETIINLLFLTLPGTANRFPENRLNKYEFHPPPLSLGD